MTVIHLRKQLGTPPAAAVVPGIRVRQLIVPDDIQPWLELRERAVAVAAPSVRAWTQLDFQREFLLKPWWRDDHAWCATSDEMPPGRTLLAGAVILGFREGQGSTVPVVHWLMVEPTLRRRGVGWALMSRLEAAAWDGGWRNVQLETHAGWTAAVAFYQSIGYALVRERSLR